MASCKGSCKVFQGTVPQSPPAGLNTRLEAVYHHSAKRCTVKKDPGAAPSGAAKAHYGLCVT